MDSERISWSGSLPHRIVFVALVVGVPLNLAGVLVGLGTTVGYVLSAVPGGGIAVVLFVALRIERRERRGRSVATTSRSERPLVTHLLGT